jgi:hypothetical protein
MKVQLHRHGFQGFLEGQVDIVTIASTVYSIIEKVHINSSFQLSLEIFEFYAQVQGQNQGLSDVFKAQEGARAEKSAVQGW